jgi:hypothetical protein
MGTCCPPDPVGEGNAASFAPKNTTTKAGCTLASCIFYIKSTYTKIQLWDISMRLQRELHNNNLKVVIVSVPARPNWSQQECICESLTKYQNITWAALISCHYYPLTSSTPNGGCRLGHINLLKMYAEQL